MFYWRRSKPGALRKTPYQRSGLHIHGVQVTIIADDIEERAQAPEPETTATGCCESPPGFSSAHVEGHQLALLLSSHYQAWREAVLYD